MASRGGGTAGTAGIGAALARFYDLDLLDDPSDVPMYLALAAKSGGRVLELCAGSGRISVPLAAAGHSVTAVDRDPNMLDRARRAWKRHPARKAGGSLKLIEHDITLLDLEDRFDLVIVALNSLVLLDGQAAQEAALRTIARHLAPGGRAVVDVWLPDDGDLELYDGRLMLEWVRRDPDSGAWVAKIGSDAPGHGPFPGRDRACQTGPARRASRGDQGRRLRSAPIWRRKRSAGGGAARRTIVRRSIGPGLI
jgi:SAM-dependent methyltransferase